MNTIAVALASAALPLLAACLDPGACTANVLPAITVLAVDAATRVTITDGARGVVSEGDFVDSLRPYGMDAALHVLLLSAADERPGVYGVFVERDGYQSVSLSAVPVSRDDCHVKTVALELTMTAIP